MLKPPTLINPPRNPFLPQPRQIRRMEHANLNSLRPMIGNQRSQKRGARSLGRFPSPSQRIRQNRHLQVRIVAKRLVQCLEELMLRFPDI